MIGEWGGSGCKEVPPWGEAREGEIKLPGMRLKVMLLRLSRNCLKSEEVPGVEGSHLSLRGAGVVFLYPPLAVYNFHLKPIETM